MSSVERAILCDHFVGGGRVKALSKRQFTALNPATNKPIATFSVGNAKDIDRAVRAARTAFDQGPWPRMTIKERASILARFAELIKANSQFLGFTESLNVGKLKSECINHEVPRAAENIAFFARAILQQEDEVFHGESNFLGKKVKMVSITRREPIGVAGLIVPWNSPLMLGTWNIAPALATGNTCVLKPPVWAPLSLLQLGDLAREAGIPAGVLNIVPGGVEAGQALVKHPFVDRIAFTGSVAAGKEVHRANAEARLAPISLELGGKAPNIVFSGVDLEETAAGVARSIFRSQGQSCVAGSRLLIERSLHDDFVAYLAGHIAAFKIGNHLEDGIDIGPLITRKHLESVESYVRIGLEEGARLIAGGKRPTLEGECAEGNFQ